LGPLSFAVLKTTGRGPVDELPEFSIYDQLDPQNHKSPSFQSRKMGFPYSIHAAHSNSPIRVSRCLLMVL